jgi:O-acetyl-ADP-ribose deacetylase
MTAEITATPQERMGIIQGDITKLTVDAIVNTANSSLIYGGSVYTAIHRAAGSELLVACRQLNGCQTGRAKITNGYQLKAKYVIHTVSPVWHDDRSDEREALTNCYREILVLAVENQIQTIAFPAISCGSHIYDYPSDLAAQVALKTVAAFLAEDSSIEGVSFVCFSDRDYDAYIEAFGML